MKNEDVLKHRDLTQRVIGVFFEVYNENLMVEECLFLELKAVRSLDSAHEAQLLNYLRATDVEVVYCSTSESNLSLKGWHLITRENTTAIALTC